jgi:hypothetical protein
MITTLTQLGIAALYAAVALYAWRERSKFVTLVPIRWFAAIATASFSAWYLYLALWPYSFPDWVLPVNRTLLVPLALAIWLSINGVNRAVESRSRLARMR